MKEDELLGWLIHQKRHSEIPEVTDEMKDKLIENTEFLAVIFCKLNYFDISPDHHCISFLFFSILQTIKMTNRISEY